MLNNFLAVVWKVDPALFRIGSWDIRYYGVLWAAAILIGALFFVKFVKREGLRPRVADSIFIYGALATIIGARLGHCFFYEPAYYFSHPLEIFNLRDGGLASHGAAIGLLVGLWLFSRKNKLPYLWSLDRVMIPVAVGGALVRIGNLMNHEIYGIPTDKPWGFSFIENVGAWMRGAEPIWGPPSHPTQLYEAICYLILFGILLWLYYGKDMGRRHPGIMFGVGLIGIFLPRFFIEYVKNPQIAAENDMFLFIGQWLSIPFIIAGIIMIIYGVKHKENPPSLQEAQAAAAKRQIRDDIAAAEKKKNRQKKK